MKLIDASSRGPFLLASLALIGATWGCAHPRSRVPPIYLSEVSDARLVAETRAAIDVARAAAEDAREEAREVVRDEVERSERQLSHARKHEARDLSRTQGIARGTARVARSVARGVRGITRALSGRRGPRE